MLSGLLLKGILIIVKDKIFKEFCENFNDFVNIPKLMRLKKKKTNPD
jgi:hypothetical protein